MMMMEMMMVRCRCSLLHHQGFMRYVYVLFLLHRREPIPTGYNRAQPFFKYPGNSPHTPRQPDACDSESLYKPYKDNTLHILTGVHHSGNTSRRQPACLGLGPPAKQSIRYIPSPCPAYFFCCGPTLLEYDRGV